MNKRADSGRGFISDVLMLATGTTIAQAVPIALSPILTRLYTPEDFGVLALYLALLGLISIAATGRYELAIMLPESEDDADSVVILSTTIALLISLLLLLAALLWGAPIARLLGEPRIEPWLLAVPAGVFLTGAYNALNYWLNRRRGYRQMSANRALQAGITGATQLGLGWAKTGVGGLMFGHILGQLATTIALTRSFFRARTRAHSSGHEHAQRCLALARRYRNHPLHIMPAQWASAASLQIPTFVITSMFGAAATGLFSLAWRMISVPSAVIATAIGDVYRERAAVAYRECGEFRSLYMSTVWLAFRLAIIPTALLYVLAPDLFALVFGEAWRTAGEYARPLAIAAFLQFVFTPVDKGAVIVGATTYIVWWCFGRLGAFIVTGALTAIFGWSLETFILLFVLINSVLYIIDAIYEYYLSSGRWKPPER